MRGGQVSVTGVGVSAPLVLDPYTAASAYTGVYLAPGAGCTASVEATPDDPFSANPNWFPAGLPALTAATTAVAALFPFPARAVRINQTVGAAAATTLKSVVSGI